ncbi:ATP-binding protein [Streptomyces sp. NPDC029674]|uniref:ATP-binding protein n=1 Tax=Streptomyces sp. NPDC029674 TaxID=3365297 RepID=UPI00385059A7
MTSPGPRDLPASPLLESPLTLDDLPRLRMLIDRHADREGLPEPRRGDFIVAIDAVATDAIAHADGGGTLVLRRANGHLECRIHDSGPEFPVGVVPGSAAGTGEHAAGSGLWLAGRITDRLTVCAGTVGAVVTLAMRLPHHSSRPPR